ncbi:MULTISPECIES: cation diffusion facilitator family transporter [Undibacterium]|jgi:cation diffusion facilitator family transporter|uniref:Cation diffusion facilitator family transporter n=1 Tax=Undibacterium umbellatum TaxID=2762300 RepID=A0ABR6ZBC5_9BURK|nr:MULTISPECIES: cation diffusion facilitator family transporter [Undibacterium]MBC3908978.1 cation diffusion facilitator family transporter [Undibacterium umbellatum]MDP1978792.1 cation diffusion facilitator family transporter [Undibacterium sp.]
MSANSEGSTKAIFYALGANGGIAVAKFTAAIFTSSGAMLAEAIHSTADCINQIFLLVGIKEAKRPPDASHPMGYGRVVYFWAMMVALLLFFLGGAFSVMEGVERLKHAEPLKNPMVALTVLGVSVILEAFSLYGAMVEIRKISEGKNFFQWFRETRQSELMVVAGEDIAALAGLGVAFIAVVLSVVTGNPVWDAVGSIIVGCLLMVIAFFIVREVKAMITGESAAPEVNEAIRAHITNHPHVDHVINLIALQWGDQLMLAVQAKMHPQASDKALIAAINEVEAGIQSKWPQVKWCFFEPDVGNTSD